jgi:hypothetical protein
LEVFWFSLASNVKEIGLGTAGKAIIGVDDGNGCEGRDVSAGSALGFL